MIQQNEAHGDAKTENKLVEIKHFRAELCLRFNRRISELETGQ